MLITSRLQVGLPSLRCKQTLRPLQDAFASASARFGFRLVVFSIQTNHLHLVVEAGDAQALTRGMQGLHVRVARALNRCWDRRGRVFADRYHARILRTPREVRYALAYALNNARKHGSRASGVDPFASGRWFDGWNCSLSPTGVLRNGESCPVVAARTWLLRVGWRRHGRIDPEEIPGGAADRSPPVRADAVGPQLSRATRR